MTMMFAFKRGGSGGGGDVTSSASSFPSDQHSSGNHSGNSNNRPPPRRQQQQQRGKGKQASKHHPSGQPPRPTASRSGGVSRTNRLNTKHDTNSAAAKNNTNDNGRGVTFQKAAPKPPAKPSTKFGGGIGKLFFKRRSGAALQQQQQKPRVATRFELPDAGKKTTRNAGMHSDDISLDMSLYTTISKATVDYRHPPRRSSSRRMTTQRTVQDDDDMDDDASRYSVEVRRKLSQMKARRAGPGGSNLGTAIEEEEYSDEDDDDDDLPSVKKADVHDQATAVGSQRYPTKAPPPKIVTHDPTMDLQGMLSPSAVTPATIPEEEDCMSYDSRKFFSGSGFKNARITVRKIVEEDDEDDVGDEYSYGTYLSEPTISKPRPAPAATTVRPSASSSAGGASGPVDLDDSDVSTTSASTSSSGSDARGNRNCSDRSELPTMTHNQVHANAAATAQLSILLSEESRIVSDEDFFVDDVADLDMTMMSQHQHSTEERAQRPVDLDRTPTPTECYSSSCDSSSNGDASSSLEPPPPPPPPRMYMAGGNNGNHHDFHNDISGYDNRYAADMSEFDMNEYDMSRNFGESLFSPHSYLPGAAGVTKQPSTRSIMSMSMNMTISESSSVVSLPVDLDAPPVDLDEEEDKKRLFMQQQRRQGSNNELNRSIVSHYSSAASTVLSMPVDLDNPPVDLDDEISIDKPQPALRLNKPTSDIEHSRSISSHSSSIRPSLVRSVVKNSSHPWQKALQGCRKQQQPTKMLRNQREASEESEEEASVTISFESSHQDDGVAKDMTTKSARTEAPSPQLLSSYHPFKKQVERAYISDDETSASQPSIILSMSKHQQQPYVFESPSKSSLSCDSRLLSSPEAVAPGPRSLLKDRRTEDAVSSSSSSHSSSSSFTASPPRTRTIWTPEKCLFKFDSLRDIRYDDSDVHGDDDIPPILTKVSEGGTVTTNSSTNANSYVYGGYDASHPLNEDLDHDDQGFHTSFLQPWPSSRIKVDEDDAAKGVDESTFDLGSTRLEMAANCFASMFELPRDYDDDGADPNEIVKDDKSRLISTSEHDDDSFGSSSKPNDTKSDSFAPKSFGNDSFDSGLKEGDNGFLPKLLGSVTSIKFTKYESSYFIDRHIGTIDEASASIDETKFDVDAMETIVVEEEGESTLVKTFLNSSSASTDSDRSSGAVLLTTDELEKHCRKMAKRVPPRPNRDGSLPPGYAAWKFQKDVDELQMELLFQQQEQAEKILKERQEAAAASAATAADSVLADASSFMMDSFVVAAEPSSTLTAAMLERCHRRSLNKSTTYKVYGDPNREDSFSMAQMSTMADLNLVDIIIPEFVDTLQLRRGGRGGCEPQLTLRMDVIRLAKEFLGTERRKQKLAEEKAKHDAEAEGDRFARMKERGLAQRRRLELEPPLPCVMRGGYSSSSMIDDGDVDIVVVGSGKNGSANSRSSSSNNSSSSSHRSLGRKLHEIDTKHRQHRGGKQHRNKQRSPSAPHHDDYDYEERSTRSKRSGSTSPSSTSDRSSSYCVVCRSNARTHMAMPCMHYSFCQDCVLAFHEEEAMEEDLKRVCPVCETADIVFARVCE